MPEFEEKIRWHLAEAQRLSASGDSDAAAEHDRALLQLDALSPAGVGRGESARELGFLELAMKHLKRLWHRAGQPGDSTWQLHLALGRTHFDLGEYREAQGHFQETSRLAGDASVERIASLRAFATALEHIADILMRHRNRESAQGLASFYEHARDKYELAGDEAGGARCRFRLAHRWVRALSPEEILAHGEQREALEIGYRVHPTHAELAFRLGQLCQAQGLERQACHCWLRLLRLGPSAWQGQARQAASVLLQRLPGDPNCLA